MNDLHEFDEIKAIDTKPKYPAMILLVLAILCIGLTMIFNHTDAQVTQQLTQAETDAQRIEQAQQQIKDANKILDAIELRSKTKLENIEKARKGEDITPPTTQPEITAPTSQVTEPPILAVSVTTENNPSDKYKLSPEVVCETDDPNISLQGDIYCVPKYLQPIIEKVAEKYDVYASYIAGQLSTETRKFNANARGSSGEYGMCQIIPKFHPGIGTDANALDPALCIDYMTSHVSSNMDKSDLEAYARWNGGPSGASKPNAVKYAREVLRRGLVYWTYNQPNHQKQLVAEK